MILITIKFTLYIFYLRSKSFIQHHPFQNCFISFRHKVRDNQDRDLVQDPHEVGYQDADRSRLRCLQMHIQELLGRDRRHNQSLS